MPQTPKRMPVVFYESSAGKEPVRDWLCGLSVEDRRIIGFDIARLEFGWPVGMPLCRSLGEGLWEVRSSLPGGRIARVFFCVDAGEMVLRTALRRRPGRRPRPSLRRRDNA